MSQSVFQKIVREVRRFIRYEIRHKSRNMRCKFHRYKNKLFNDFTNKYL